MIEVYGDGGRPQIEANGKAIADSQTEAVTVDEILSDGRGNDRRALPSLTM
jgi:hypothetical protein